MTIDRFILASASPRRKELLEKIGIEPEIIPSSLEENITETSPDKVVMSLSGQKAEDIASSIEPQENSGVLILGADTVVSIDGRILGKPHSHEEAAEMIRSLQGRTHQVFTGVTIIVKEKSGNGSEVRIRKETFSVKTDVQVYPMNEKEILDYANSQEPMDKAGAYGIQGTFAKYVKGIEGDYNNVVGLPVSAVYQKIRQYNAL